MVQIGIILGYFFVVFWVSYIQNKRNHNIQEYVTGSGTLGTLFIVPLILSELIGGSATIGVAANGYQYGIASVWSLVSMGIGCILAVIFVTKFYRVMACKGAVSAGHSFAMYFDERSRLVVMGINVVVCLILFSLQPVAAAAIVAPLLGVDPTLCAWVVGVFFVITAVLGGIKGVAKASVMHTAIMCFGLGLVAVLALKSVGGFGAVVSALPETYFDPMQPSKFQVVAWILGGSINVPAGAVITGAILSSRSLKEANKSLVLSGLLLVPFSIMISLIGITAKASGMEMSGNSIIFQVANQLGPVVSGIASMAILAAMLDAGSLLVLSSGSLTRDFYARFINKDANDIQEGRASKIITVILGTIGVVMGIVMPGSLLSKIMGAFQIRACAGLVIMLAMVLKKLNNDAAFWSILSGGIVATVWFFAGNPFGVEPLWPSLCVTILVVIGFLTFTKEAEYIGYTQYQKDLENYKDSL